MKKVLMALVAVLLVVPTVLFSGCNAGPDVNRQYDYTGFTNVQVGSAFEVTVTPSESYSVSVTIPENWSQYLKVEKSGSTLEVNLDWGGAFWNSWGANSRPKVAVTMPKLDILDLSGACNGTAKGFKSTGDFKLALSGASSAEVDIQAYDTSLTLSGASRVNGNLTGHDIRVNLSGASSSNLAGSGNSVNLQASGASNATLKGLPVTDARVELSGASRATVTASGKMDVFLSGASNLDYYGNVVIGRLDSSGASSVNHKS